MLVKHSGRFFEIPGETIDLELDVNWDEDEGDFYLVLSVERTYFEWELKTSVISKAIESTSWPGKMYLCESQEIQDIILHMWLTQLKPRLMNLQRKLGRN